ncbi:MAG: hypothetical protein RBS80_03765 [Thermoguttaceae bacterium]|nr:hypothetical protein [Thermoguttaceae bacterium]
MIMIKHCGLRLRLAWVVLCGCAVVALGCGSGGDGPQRYNLSGTVTFDGKPVPYGTISMAPDTSKGNSGPGSFAQIRDGRYQTERGAGTVGGPHVFSIMGLTGFPGSEGFDPETGVLFDSFDLNVDLPMANTTYDIAVPASAASGR